MRLHYHKMTCFKYKDIISQGSGYKKTNKTVQDLHEKNLTRVGQTEPTANDMKMKSQNKEKPRTTGLKFNREGEKESIDEKHLNKINLKGFSSFLGMRETKECQLQCF